MMPITFACVWTGNGAPYTEEWVQKLQRAVKRNCLLPHRFVCLTDRDHIDGVETIKLQHDWPKYWAKMELFKPYQFDGLVVYLDLDVLITGDITPMIKDWGRMMMLTDVFPEIANSTFMVWDGTDSFYHGLYSSMVLDAERIQYEYRDQWPKPNFGDQAYIDDWLARNGRPHKRWQNEMLETMFRPFSHQSKLDPQIAAHEWPSDMRLCYCLGNPKFHQHLDHPLVKEHWV